jgi:nucleotide-binding universal stress UspA family protein
MPDFKSIVYCTDFSENADFAFAEARYMAGVTGAKLFVVHVTPGHDAEAATASWKAQEGADHLRETYPVEGAEYVALYGNEAAAIMRFAEGQTAPLIVIGARGIGAIASLFSGGSVADKIARNAKGPVLIVPAA